MGLYYSAPPPFIGASGPLLPERVTPPVSGPLPQNPPFPGAKAPLALQAWVVAANVSIPIWFGAPEPFAPRQLTPPSFIPSTPPIIGGRLPAGYAAWTAAQIAAIPVWLGTQQPYTKRPPTPPSGPTPQNPPVVGTDVPLAALNWRDEYWRPPPVWLGNDQPYQQVQLVPPISGPTPQNPPITGTKPPLAATHWRTEQWRPDPVFIGTSGPYLPIKLSPALYPGAAVVFPLFSAPLKLSGQFMGVAGLIVGANGRIVQNDYNNLVVEMLRVYGSGFGDVGYGQSAVTLTQTAYNTPDTAAQWNNLKSGVTTCANHQGTSIATIPSYVANGRILASDVSNMQSIAYALKPNRLNTNGGASLSVITNAYTNTRAANWGSNSGLGFSAQTITATWTVDFTTEDKARFFFNSGGQIKIRWTQTETVSGLEQAWNTFFTDAGTVIFAAHTTSTAGSTGGIGTGSAIGFYELTDTAQQIYNASDSVSTVYSTNTIQITAQRRNFVGANGGNGTGIQFACTFNEPHTSSNVSGLITGGTTNMFNDYAIANVVLSGITTPTFATVSGF